jgi:hypothetical protein
MNLIKQFGQTWARNDGNISRMIEFDVFGIYVLYDGSMPVYVGMGNIGDRLVRARKSDRRGQMWDHFSWYVPSKRSHVRELEALVIGMLPAPLRMLNRQKGRLSGKVKQRDADKQPEPITRKPPQRRRRG